MIEELVSAVNPAYNVELGSLKEINKGRNPVWYHFWQFFYVLQWIIKR